MDQETSAVTRAMTREYWNQARRKAFWQRLSSNLGLTREPVSLLAFEDVQQKLRLNQNAYRGLQQVPLDQIVGSVGRYHDFTHTFLPLVESDSERWQRVAELQIEAGLPPVELYKVGDAYFVKDGNHRVSVARHFGAKTIEAYVWEYETKVGGVSPEGAVDDLIVKAEYRAFLDRTRLDLSRPDSQIVITEPGSYPELEAEIELYRENLERIDGEARTYQSAADTWYDLVYSLAVDLIRESGVLEQFPGRTEADLYLWAQRHRRELTDRYGAPVSLRDVVAQIAERHQRPGPVERAMQTAARSVVGLVHSLTAERSTVRDFVIPPGEDEPLGKLLAQMRSTRPSQSYAGQRGDAWREWRSALRERLVDLLGLQYQHEDEVEVIVTDAVVVSGVERLEIRLRAADDVLLPGYLMRPVNLREPVPALLVYPGHGTIQQTAGLSNSPHHANALALAQAGYVTITIEARGVGELGQVDHTELDNLARLMGRTWLTMTVEDGLRALDYLQTRSDVKPTHLGVTGLGVAGGLALYTAALDERIRAMVIENYLGGGIDPLTVRGHSCDFVPGLLQYFDLSDVARAVAPRPALYAYAKDDPRTRIARAWFDEMRPLYETFGCPDRTRFVEHEEGDGYDRATAKAWFDRWLVEEEDTSVLMWASRE
jgi:dienelactone hydrolase